MKFFFNCIRLPGEKKGTAYGIQNQEGFILVLCMLIMVVLTVIGIAATRNTTVELQIAGNDKIYAEDLYLAEGNAYEAARRLEAESSDNLKIAKLEMDTGVEGAGVVKSDEMASYDAMDQDFVEDLLTTTDHGNIAVAGEQGGVFACVDRGIEIGSSLSLPNSSQMHSFHIYGHASQKNTNRIIRLGYKKRF